MALATTGLQTQIWNNNLKSLALLLSYPLLILGIAWALFAAHIKITTPVSVVQQTLDNASYQIDITNTDLFFRSGEMVLNHSPLIIGGVAVWFIIAFFLHQRIINASTGAHRVTRREQPRIYNMLENLCISRGLPMPEFYIIESDALNAYASGLNESNFAITLTRGIINSLDDEALEAVIAHELSHIRNRDVRLLVISVIFVGIISFLFELLFQNIFYRRHFNSAGESRTSTGRAPSLMFFLAAAVAILFIGKLLAVGIRLTISRSREYMADAGAVELTKNPDAMIRALRIIENRANIPNVPHEVQQMFIENASEMVSWFSTHPTIDQRVEALTAMGGRDTHIPPSNAPASMNEYDKIIAEEIGTNAAVRSPWGKLRNKVSPWHK